MLVELVAQPNCSFLHAIKYAYTTYGEPSEQLLPPKGHTATITEPNVI